MKKTLLAFALIIISFTMGYGALAQESGNADSSTHLKEQAAKLGLPETATLDDILAQYTDDNRRKQALSHGLPETASWSDIIAHSNENTSNERDVKPTLPEASGLGYDI